MATQASKQKFIDEDYEKFIAHGMPQEMAVFAANEHFNIYTSLETLGVFKFQKYVSAFTQNFLYPYGIAKPSGISKIVSSIFLTALSAVPVVGAIAAPITGGIMQSSYKTYQYGTDIEPLTKEILLPTVLQQSKPQTTSVSNQSSNTNQNQSQTTMKDLIKKWLFPLLSLLIGAGSIVYYTSAKSAQDKKKRKLFLWVGIAAAAVGGIMAYKKFKS